MRVKITIWADPRQIERMAKSGVLSPSKSDRIWMSTVRETVKEAGFDLTIETGPGFDAYRNWDLTMGNHSVRFTRAARTEPLDYMELAATFLGDCKCSGGPCGCSTRGREILAGLLPVIIRNAESAVEFALESGEYAVDEASLGLSREADEEKHAD